METPAEVGTLVPQPHGGSLRRGNPDNRGGGRIRDEFKRRCGEIIDKPELLKYVEECATGVHGPSLVLGAVNFLTDRAIGREPTVSRIESSDRPLIIELVRE